jgi:DNA-binding transcriptional ArsR family regulator
MLSYVPYTFDLYAPLPRYLHASAARMVSIARRDGVCWWSIRTFARLVGISKSTASRHLAVLTQAFGFATRRRAGGGYEYTINARFLPRGAVSHGRAPGVPRRGSKNITVKNKGKIAFEKEAGLPDERAQWAARVRGFRQSGFWPVFAGPKPGEAGCQVPRELLAM